MIRHIGHSAARSRVLEERRRIAADTPAEREGRLMGQCDHCHHAHAWPDVRKTCVGCGEIRCHGWCRCEEEDHDE